MSKNLFIAEKKSVGQEFAKTLKITDNNDRKGFLETGDNIVTWCRGHLVSMCYPEEYDPNLKWWRYDTIPFIPDTFKYQVIEDAKKEFGIVSGLMNRNDVSCIYVCTDSGREGEYIYRLVEDLSGMTGKQRKRVWIDSQTEEEILRGIREAKDLSEYDNLSDSAYLRAKEDYLMGINFSRALTLKFSNPIKDFLQTDRATVSVGRVMTCVLGIVVDREREIRNFVKTPFYRVIAGFDLNGTAFDGEWRVNEKSVYADSPLLYKENGFKDRETAQKLIDMLMQNPEGTQVEAEVSSATNKKEAKNPPLLFNLAELQNVCSKLFKISPAETLKIAQELYDKKLTTYPRTDARVLSTAVSKEINKNLTGLTRGPIVPEVANDILTNNRYKNLEKTKYVNDKQITDHYAIIPTGQTNGVNNLSPTSAKVYELIVRRFLSIFMPSAVYQKVALVLNIQNETFYASFKVLAEPGYLNVIKLPTGKNGTQDNQPKETNPETNQDSEEEKTVDISVLETLKTIKKGARIPVSQMNIKEGETSPPKRYNSGELILTMENAGKFIEDEELRSQIKGSGIGTSATRAEILEKLVRNKYLSLNPKTQIYTPTLLGEIIYEVVAASIKQLLSPKMTASWEKGLSGVADGSISADEYMEKLSSFVSKHTDNVKNSNSNASYFKNRFAQVAQYYSPKEKSSKNKGA